MKRVWSAHFCIIKNLLESNIRKLSCECILLVVLNIHLLLFYKCSLQIPLMAQKMSNDTVLILMALIYAETLKNLQTGNVRWDAQVTGLVWFGLFVHPFSHICNTGHVNYR